MLASCSAAGMSAQPQCSDTELGILGLPTTSLVPGSVLAACLVRGWRVLVAVSEGDTRRLNLSQRCSELGWGPRSTEKGTR